MYRVASVSSFFFFNDTATTEIYTLSLHDALPISRGGLDALLGPERPGEEPVTPFVLLDGVHKQWSPTVRVGPLSLDRKSTRLNSSHSQISYAVFCLKKKKNTMMCNVLRSLEGYLY